MRTLEQLFLRYRERGDVRALGRVFDRAAPELYSVARYLARGSVEPEDLVQSTFLAAIESAGRFDADRRLLPWLLGVLATQARKEGRRDARTPDPARLSDRTDEDPARDSQGAEVERAVEAALRELPEDYADTLRLHLVEGLAPRDCAARLGIRPVTARVRLHRGLRRLRAALPVGLAGTFAATSVPAAAWKAIRRRVLHDAGAGGPRSASAGTSLSASGSTPIVVGATALGAALVALAAFGLLPEPDAASDVRQLAHSQLAPALEGTSALTAATEVDPVVRTPVAARSADGLATRDDPAPSSRIAHIAGQLVGPDGRGVAGVELDLHGWPRDDSAPQQGGEPWTDPPRAHTDAAGAFRIPFEPPPTHQFMLRVIADRLSPARWRFASIETGATVDLGSVALGVAAIVSGRIVDVEGRPARGGWTVIVEETAVVGASEARTGARAHGEADRLAGTFRVVGCPSGEVLVRASSGGRKTEATRVRVASGGEATAELVFDGPDPTRAIEVFVNPERFGLVNFLSESVAGGSAPELELQPAGGDAIEGVRASAVLRWTFADLAAGEYDLSVRHPIFRDERRNGLRPGRSYGVELAGDVSIELTLQDPATANPIERAGVRLHLPDEHRGHTPDGVVLLADGSPLPAGTVIEGLPPVGFVLEVRAEGHAPTSVAIGDWSPAERRAIVVEPLLTSPFSGTVFDTDGVTPLEGALVECTAGRIAGRRERDGYTVTSSGAPPLVDDVARTDALGRFVFQNAPAGPCTVRVHWSPWLFSDSVFDSPQDAPEDWRLRAPPNGRLRGRILLPEGRDARDLILRFGSAGGWKAAHGIAEPFGAVVHPDGSFEAGPLPTGRGNLGFERRRSHARAGWTSWTSPFQTVDIPEGEVVDVEIDARACYPVQIELALSVAGEPYGGGEVLMRSLDRSGSEHWLGFGASHSMSPPDLTPGAYRVVAQLESLGICWPDPDPVVLRAGEDRVVSIDVPLVRRRVRFLDGGSRAPWSERAVSFASGEKVPSGFCGLIRTDADGWVELALPAGPASFRVGGAAGLLLQRAELEWPGAGAELEVILPLERR